MGWSELTDDQGCQYNRANQQVSSPNYDTLFNVFTRQNLYLYDDVWFDTFLHAA